MGINNLSFRTKMFIIIFIVTLLPMIVVSTLLYQRAQQSIVGQTEKVVISSINFAVGNIDTALDSVTGISKLVLTDTRLRQFGERPLPANELERNNKYAELRDLLNYFLSRIKVQNVVDGIDSFYLYFPKHNVLLDSGSTYYENVDTENVDFLMGKPEDKWFVSIPVNYYTLNNIRTRLETNKVITFKRVLRDEAGNTIAELAVNVKDKYIGDYYSKVQRGVPGDFFVVTPLGESVAYSDKNRMGMDESWIREIGQRTHGMEEENGIFEMKDHDLFTFYYTSGYTGWKYIVTIPSSEILGKVYDMRMYVLGLILVLALLLVGVTYFLSNLYYQPLLKLVKAMQTIENRNLDIRIEDTRKDEYRKVFQGFNNMADELESHVRDLAYERVLKKDAEIKLLQAQIHPHFLYNTLDSIYSIAKINKVEEISSMVAALSKFFRVSLSGGQDQVTLKEAVALVDSYLTILNIRYRGGISFEVNVPEEWAECEVPKLILQPIVENAVYHGLEKQTGAGHIVISATGSNGTLFLTVEDNGIGMKEAELARLKQAMEVAVVDREQGFALKNLFQQIRLLYGPEFGVDIESVYGKGTRVIVRIPSGL